MAAIDKARSHPLRRRILLSMRELDKPVSAKVFVGHAGVSWPGGAIKHVAYHFRVLQGAGLIKLVDQQPRRGAMERYYSPTPTFTAEILDTAAMDRIAEILEACAVDAAEGEDVSHSVKTVARVVFASGRPVIGGEG